METTPPLLDYSRISAPQVLAVPGTAVRLPCLTVNLAQSGDSQAAEICLFFLPNRDGWMQATDMAWFVLERWWYHNATVDVIHHELTSGDWATNYQAVIVLLYDGDGDALGAAAAIEEFCL